MNAHRRGSHFHLQIEGVDVNAPHLGALFRVPVTVIVPEKIQSRHLYRIFDLDFKPGQARVRVVWCSACFCSCADHVLWPIVDRSQVLCSACGRYVRGRGLERSDHLAIIGCILSCS